MMLIYIAIALFFFIILWLALQPKQGTRAANAPDPDDTSHQLPKPKHPKTAPKALDTQKLPKVSYELPEPEIENDVQGTTIQAQLSSLMQQGRKIEAIKLVRVETNWGLKQAKDYIELFPNLPPLPSKPASTITQPSVRSADIDRHDINDRIRLLMQQHRKIEAIKVIRTVTNWNLKKCKEYLDCYPDVTPIAVDETGPVSAQIRQLLSEQKYMEAIHLVENRTGMMASEAKQYIEQQFDYRFPF